MRTIPDKRKGKYLPGREMPGWEKVTLVLMAIYIIIVLGVFWYLGWKQLGFPRLP